MWGGCSCRCFRYRFVYKRFTLAPAVMFPLSDTTLGNMIRILKINKGILFGGGGRGEEGRRFSTQFLWVMILSIQVLDCPSFWDRTFVCRGDFLIYFSFFRCSMTQSELTKGCPLPLMHFQSKSCNHPVDDALQVVSWREPFDHFTSRRLGGRVPVTTRRNDTSNNFNLFWNIAIRNVYH